MKAITLAFVLSLIVSIPLLSQVSLSQNTDDTAAIEITDDVIKKLCHGTWECTKVYQNDNYKKSETLKTVPISFLENFRYNQYGNWRIEGKYLLNLDFKTSPEAPESLKGIYTIQEITDSTLVLKTHQTPSSNAFTYRFVNYTAPKSYFWIIHSTPNAPDLRHMGAKRNGNKVLGVMIEADTKTYQCIDVYLPNSIIRYEMKVENGTALYFKNGQAITEEDFDLQTRF